MAEPRAYAWLDAAQLVKHAFGLAHTFFTQPVTLLYLYWEPSNATEFPMFGEHRAEIARFAAAVEGDGPAGGDVVPGALASVVAPGRPKLAGCPRRPSEDPLRRRCSAERIEPTRSRGKSNDQRHDLHGRQGWRLGTYASRCSRQRRPDASLVAQYPELIGDEDGGLLLIRREQPIADSVDGAGRWSLDHLFVTRSGIPVLVELKRAVDSRLRREIVGQMLDYAANAVAHWRSGTIAIAFADTCERGGMDPAVTLSDFIDGADASTFWEQVDSNFQSGRVKLVFVADIIPRELARIVEFLNEQMRADVRAIELRWFEGDGGLTTLVPRIIGETERAIAQKATATSALPEPIDAVEWIEKHIRPKGDDAVDGAAAFMALVTEAGGTPVVSLRQQGSIYGSFTLRSGGSVCPMHLAQDAHVSLSFKYLTRRPGLADEAVRRRIYEEFVAVVGPLRTSNLSGFPSFKIAAFNNPRINAELRSAVLRLIEAATSE